MRAMGNVVALVLALTVPVLAQEKPSKPDTPEQAAEKVLAAFKAKDEPALKPPPLRSGGFRRLIL